MDLNATQRIENRSARIEAKGDLSVTTPTLVNANEHFKTELVAQPGQRYLRLRHHGVDYKAEDLGLNFDRLDRYDDQAHYAVLLPSSEYPFSQYPALADQWAVSADGRYQVQLSRVEEVLCPGSDCNARVRDVYAPEHGIWQRLGVTPFGTTPPAYGGPVCDGDQIGCSGPQWAQYQAWQQQMREYQAHKAGQQNALDQKITAYNDSVRARTLSDWTVVDATATDHNPKVVSSAPGQIVSGGDMRLNVATELLNHNSEILAGGALKTQGAALENRGSEVIARTELSGQAVRSWLREEGLFKNDDRLYEVKINPSQIRWAPHLTSTCCQLGVCPTGLPSKSAQWLTDVALKARANSPTGEEIAALNLPEPVRQALTQVVGAAIGGAVGGTAGAATSFNQTARNYVTHSPYRGLAKHPRLQVERKQKRPYPRLSTTELQKSMRGWQRGHKGAL